jgi:hypothetical protein
LTNEIKGTRKRVLVDKLDKALFAFTSEFQGYDEGVRLLKISMLFLMAPSTTRSTESLS